MQIIFAHPILHINSSQAIYRCHDDRPHQKS